MNSKIIVMAGGTASGKSTIAKTFKAQGMTVLEHDRYYKDIPHPKGFNFDEPNALDNALLIKHIHMLKCGKAADIPIYDFSSHSRTTKTETIQPHACILIEGILTLAIPQVAQLADLRIFVDTPDDIRLMRRIRRDVLHRGRDVEGVLNQYIQTVRPMHIQHIAPTQQMADLILDGTAPVKDNQHRIQHAIKQSLGISWSP